MTRLIVYRCTSCGGTEISYDASAEWDAGRQQFVVRSTYDACFCNSEACQGEERNVAEFDAQTGEALGLGPGSFEYILKEQAEAAWATYHEVRKAERAPAGTNHSRQRRSTGGSTSGDDAMRLNIYTLATDDKNGTRADVFCSETERDDALLAWVNSDRAQWAGSKFADDLHEYVLSKIEFLDTFSTDEQEVEIDPAALMSVNTAWKLCKVAPGSFGNLYDPEEVTTILDGWGEEGDEDGTSHWFDPDRAEDHAAILAWCEAEGKQREQPHVWSPKNASATIHRDPEEQETFIVVKSAENDGDQDIQIKLRPDMIVLRRDFKDVWEGVKVDAFAVSVKVVNLSIRINHDGSINREDGDSTTWIEADGSVLKKTEFVDATMSGDGVELTRRTHLLSLGRQQCNLAGPLFPVFLKRARICKGAGFLIALKP